jgi:hypothetical protein
MYAETSWRPPPSRPFLNLQCFPLCSVAAPPLRTLAGLSTDVVGAFFNTPGQRCQAVGPLPFPRLRGLQCGAIYRGACSCGGMDGGWPSKGRPRAGCRGNPRGVALRSTSRESLIMRPRLATTLSLSASRIDRVHGAASRCPTDCWTIQRIPARQLIIDHYRSPQSNGCPQQFEQQCAAIGTTRAEEGVCFADGDPFGSTSRNYR